ncbi:MAG TPA: flagellar motor switch protein FliG, partial [Dehalococcoidia bacterium]
MAKTMPTTATKRFTGRQRAAVLLIALGPERSAEILRHLREDDIERLTAEVYRIGQVDPETRTAVLEEFYTTVMAQEYVSSGGVEYAEEMLERAVGKPKAQEIIERVTATARSVPFSFTRDLDPPQLLNYLQHEHPQTIALVLAHMPPDRAAMVLSGLAPELQAEVAHRIALMDRTTPEVVREVEEVLQKKLASAFSKQQELSAGGGLDSLVRLIKQVDRGTEKTILDALERTDPKLAEDIKKHMFVFENITLLDDRSIQRVLREVDIKDLGLALKGASEEVRQRIFAN